MVFHEGGLLSGPFMRVVFYQGLSGGIFMLSGWSFIMVVFYQGLSSFVVLFFNRGDFSFFFVCFV